MKHVAVLLFCVLLSTAAAGALTACALLGKVTPADRAAAYAREAQAAQLECKAYSFDLAAGLTPDVPSMTELCGSK